MANVVFAAKATLNQKVQVSVQARQHKVLVDEPSELGGDDEGMNPVELVLSALGSCYVIVMQVYAEKFNVKYENLSVDVEGDLNPEGFLGNDSVPAGFTQIRYTVNLKSSDSAEKIQKLLDYAHRHCPVGDTLTRSIPVVVQPVNITS